jgi:hypothetical protein
MDSPVSTSGVMLQVIARRVLLIVLETVPAHQKQEPLHNHGLVGTTTVNQEILVTTYSL